MFIKVDILKFKLRLKLKKMELALILRLTFMLILVSSVFSLSICYAQQGSNSSSQKSDNKGENKGEKKKHILNFEDELVQGSAQKPELFYLFQRKNFNYKRLIRLRENFLPEMRQTSEVVNRNWSGN